MKTLKIKLENFKEIRRAEYRFNGKSADVCDRNGSGKTTITDSLT